MYNLIIGFTQGEATSDRVLEYTDDALRAWVAPNGTVDPSRLRTLPTLIMPELGDSTTEQLARVGHVEDLVLSRGTYRFRFNPNPAIPPISTEKIEALAGKLGITSRWEFNRHHWAVKDVDLYQILYRDVVGRFSEPTTFRLPRELPIEKDLVAVMMPFGAPFTPVYETLKGAVEDAGMRCHRADDIWINNHIFEDIISLIWRSRVVITDLTGKNPNVFYETGIAHTLGRDTIQITQNMEDVPFDLKTIRTLPYLNNDQGRKDLRPLVTARLNSLSSQL